MATLPPSTDITSSTATEGNAKTWFAALRSYIAQQLGANGTQAESLAMLGAPFNGTVPKSGAYTVLPADRGKVLNCSGNFTLSLSAVSVLGDGFMFAVWNSGSGTITLDPYLAELIDGAATKAITAGQFAVIYCSGTAFSSVGSVTVPVTSVFGRTGAVTLTSGDVTGALGYTPVQADPGSGGMSQVTFAIGTTLLAGMAAGTELYLNDTVAPRSNGVGVSLNSGATYLTGTWKCRGFASSTSILVTRIA